MKRHEIKTAVMWRLADGPRHIRAIREDLERLGARGDDVRDVVAKMLDNGELVAGGDNMLRIRRAGDEAVWP